MEKGTVSGPIYVVGIEATKFYTMKDGKFCSLGLLADSQNKAKQGMKYTGGLTSTQVPCTGLWKQCA